jgi:hypothetical protein
MSLHDEYARVTPFEIAFPDEDFVERLIAAIDEEASSRGVDAEQVGVFVTLGSVADAVRELQGPDAPAGSAHELAALLFHVVHFSRAGRPVYLLQTAATRYLVEGAPEGDPTPPVRSAYLQLPQHLFWMGAGTEGVPESIDGLFWFASDDGRLHVLPVTGVLPERMAFRALPLPEVPLRDAALWLDADVRESGPDFTSSLPGHDLDRLYAMETAGEVLKLVARFFAYLDVAPGAGQERAWRPDGDGPHEGSRRSAPPPSRLGYTTVQLVA